MKKGIICPHCGETEKQNKQRQTKTGSQKYLCRECKRVYMPKSKRREYYTKKIKPKKVFNERVEVIEMDELYSFIERKKQNLCDNASK